MTHKIQEDIPQVGTIAILLFGLLGDVLMRTPVIKILKQYYPGSKLYLFTDPIGYEVFKNCTSIEEVIIVDRSKTDKLRYYINRINAQKRLLSLKPDMVIDLYGGNSAKRMMKLSFAKYKIGFDNWRVYSNKPILKYLLSLEKFKNPHHLTSRVLRILSFLPSLEEEKLATTPVLCFSEKSNNIMQKYIETVHLKKKYFISIGSGGKEKQLPIETIAAFLEYIYTTYGYTPLIAKNPSQEYLQKELSNQLLQKDIPHHNLEMLSISDIQSLMKAVDFVIVPDTGLYHLAVGVGVPVFCYFTYTNPKLVEPDEGIYQMCYKEIEEFDNFGLYKCSSDIDTAYLQDCFANFQNKLMILKGFQ